MAQYLIVYYAIGLFDKCFTRYELDLSVDNSATPVTKFSDYQKSNGKEYAILLNNAEDDFENEN